MCQVSATFYVQHTKHYQLVPYKNCPLLGRRSVLACVVLASRPQNDDPLRVRVRALPNRRWDQHVCSVPSTYLQQKIEWIVTKLVNKEAEVDCGWLCGGGAFDSENEPEMY